MNSYAAEVVDVTPVAVTVTLTVPLPAGKTAVMELSQMCIRDSGEVELVQGPQLVHVLE